jgi:hypothetical protein
MYTTPDKLVFEITIQRRIDAYECLELPFIKTEEAQRIRRGLMKYDIMWSLNKVGYIGLMWILYKGRFIERGRHEGYSIPRLVQCATLCMSYLYFGDYLASCLLWNDYKYIYYKYEPIIRNIKSARNPNFKIDKMTLYEES